ncbi:MAG: TetR/AcrR family transcriptional regulator [Myxococcota bacterium]
MARPVSIPNEQILAAARQVFLKQGFSASTSAIARAAQVSEGMLFKRFGSKDELFHAALEIPLLDLSKELDGRVGRGDVRSNLEWAALELINFFEELMPTVMTLWRKHAPNMKALWVGQEDPQPVRILRDLTRYISAEVERGRLDGRVEPGVLARILVGSTHHYAFLDQMGLQPPLGRDVYARQLVDMVWRGITPREDT